MISLQIKHIKSFMQQLLCSDLFDRFLLQEATIVKDGTFSIDGHIHPAQYTKEELASRQLTPSSILPYEQFRSFCFELMKGQTTPYYFKFIFQLSPAQQEATLNSLNLGLTSNDVEALLYHIIFQDGKLILTTGISYRTFIMDHTLDAQWDKLSQQFLYKHEIDFEIL